jgi:hypothetical protein
VLKFVQWVSFVDFDDGGLLTVVHMFILALLPVNTSQVLKT